MATAALLPTAAAAEPIRLGSEHAEACQRLSAAAGWGHTAADWRCRLAAGIGHGVMDEGRLVAAGVAFPAAPLCGWFGMLLVEPAHRGRGLGAAVTERASVDLARLGLATMALFAVPKAVPLYQRLGFRTVGAMTSFSGEATGDGSVVPAMTRGLHIRSIEPRDLAGLLALDRAAYGADRTAMLDDQIARFPALSLLAETGRGPKGFALAAVRGAQNVVGPVVADEAGTALALVDAVMARLCGPLRLDSLRLDGADRATFQAGLTARGFLPRAEIPLMVRGSSPAGMPFADPTRLYVAQSAAAG